MLNKQKGNMYGFVTHTWNPIKGRCSHACEYCYMKPFWKSDVHLDEKELKTNLGEGNFIFVGSSTDMFAKDVKFDWICDVLDYIHKFPDNTYLFQTKNPKRFKEFWNRFPESCIYGTTLETNKSSDISKAPDRFLRVRAMKGIYGRKMITIEPIIDFDLEEFVATIETIKPEFVNIGADSKGHNLPEPSAEKIGKLIKELKKFTKVNLKENLKRIYPNE